MATVEALRERFSGEVYDGIRHRAGTAEALLSAPKLVDYHGYLVTVRVRADDKTEVRAIWVSASSARDARRQVASEMGLSIVHFIGVKRVD